MQEKEQKISPIKQRILQFAETLGISKRDFYAKIGVSRGTLEANTGITEDVLAKFIATFPDISPDWLLTGNGPMLRDEQPSQAPAAAPPPKVIYESDPRDIRLIEALERNVKHLERDIKHLEKLAEEAIETKNNAIDDCRKSTEAKDKYIARLECENDAFRYDATANLDLGLTPARSVDVPPASGANPVR